MTDVNLTYKNVHIRKPHRCYGCNKRFPVGTYMNYWAGVTDSEFSSGYSCLNCQMFLESRLVDEDDDFFSGDIPWMKQEAAPEMFEKEDEDD